MDGRSFFKYQPDPMSLMSRPSCSECGQGGIEWMRAEDLASRVAPDQRARVNEGLAYVGVDGDAWFCPACGGFGILSGGQWEGL